MRLRVVWIQRFVVDDVFCVCPEAAKLDCGASAVVTEPGRSELPPCVSDPRLDASRAEWTFNDSEEDLFRSSWGIFRCGCRTFSRMKVENTSVLYTQKHNWS